MIGTLQKIDVTEELVWKVAKAAYGSSSYGGLCDQNEHVKGIWHDDVITDLNTFNKLVGILKECKIECRVENSGRWHDVDEFYKE